MTDPITSRSNPRIKSLVRLRSRRHRDREGRFLVEGFREVSRALEAGLQIESLFICPELYLGENEDALVGRVSVTGAEVVIVAEDPFRKVSYRDRPEGVLAVAAQFDTSMALLRADERSLFLVVESIEKPGNLGSMLRTAAAAGTTGVIVADPTTDPFNPNVIRASLGHVFCVPLAVASTDETIRWLRSHAIAIVATTPDATTSHDDVDLTGPAALVVGSEQYGLSEQWLDVADERLVISMPGPVDSLNTATAAAIVLFEAVRQRRRHT